MRPPPDPRPTLERGVLLEAVRRSPHGRPTTTGSNPAVVREIAEPGRLNASGDGIQTAIVVGGGNIFRGLAASARGMDRATGDYMGMLATVMNGLALQDALEQGGCPTRVMSAMAMPSPTFGGAGAASGEGGVVVMVAGTGNPYFTTDTAATLRAVEVHAQVILKATRVDGVYDADPETNPGAQRYSPIGYTELLSNRLQALDATAVSLAMDNEMPIVVFDMTVPGNIARAVRGERIGTLMEERSPDGA